MERNFAAVMSELRHARGLSQRKVAADLKISQALLSHYENGAREPGARVRVQGVRLLRRERRLSARPCAEPDLHARTARGTARARAGRAHSR